MPTDHGVFDPTDLQENLRVGHDRVIELDGSTHLVVGLERVELHRDGTSLKGRTIERKPVVVDLDEVTVMQVLYALWGRMDLRLHKGVTETVPCGCHPEAGAPAETPKETEQ